MWLLGEANKDDGRSMFLDGVPKAIKAPAAKIKPPSTNNRLHKLRREGNSHIDMITLMRKIAKSDIVIAALST